MNFMFLQKSIITLVNIIHIIINSSLYILFETYSLRGRRT